MWIIQLIHHIELGRRTNIKEIILLSSLSSPSGFIQTFNSHYCLWFLKFHCCIFCQPFLNPWTGREGDEEAFFTLMIFLFSFKEGENYHCVICPNEEVWGLRPRRFSQLTTDCFHCFSMSVITLMLSSRGGWMMMVSAWKLAPNSLFSASAKVKRPRPGDWAPYAKCTSWEEPLTSLIFPTHKLLVQDVIWEWKGHGQDDWGQLLPRGFQQQSLSTKYPLLSMALGQERCQATKRHRWKWIGLSGAD